jgi:DNA-binding SARP family transcriptional activator
VDRAAALLRDAVEDPQAGQDVVRTVAYVRAAIRLLTGGVRPDPSELETLVLDAEVAGQPWWARLGCALMEAEAGQVARLELVHAQAAREEDLWGTAIIRLLHGIAMREAAILEDAATVFDQLDAPVLRLWANGLAAVAAGEVRPGRVQQAEAAGKALGVRGALAVAQRWAAATATVPPVQPAAAQLRVLGGFGLTIGGVPVDESSVRLRARQTLHMLALHAGRSVHRDVLMQAIWPDSRPDAGCRNVHVAISSLRHLLEPDARRGQSLLLQRRGDSYSLILPSGSCCDLLDFEVMLASPRAARLSADLPAERASLHRALSCYAGDLLPEDGSAEWVVAERERLCLAAADAAERLARAEAAAGDISTAVEQARRALSFDPYRDTAWRLLVELHEQAGDVSAAHAVRRQYGDVLAELGLS